MRQEGNKGISSGSLFNTSIRYGADSSSRTNIHSDKERTSFYTYSVNAKAAYITDNQDYVVARAILFMDVTD